MGATDEVFVLVGPAKCKSAAGLMTISVDIARADARSIFSTYGRHLSAIDGDGAALALISTVVTRPATDAGSIKSTSGIDHAAVDGDVDALGGTKSTATDAGATAVKEHAVRPPIIGSARSVDDAAIDGNGAA